MDLCRRGTCCKRDTPDYVYPKTGDWQPFIGTLGVMASDGDKVECHVCGGWYSFLGIHAAKAHGLLAFEYKALFGLPMGEGLTGPVLQSKFRAAVARMDANAEAGRAAIRRMTSEQRSKAAAGYKPRGTKWGKGKRSRVRAA